VCHGGYRRGAGGSRRTSQIRPFSTIGSSGVDSIRSRFACSRLSPGAGGGEERETWWLVFGDEGEGSAPT
jgi:hypothetical protein